MGARDLDSDEGICDARPVKTGLSWVIAELATVWASWLVDGDCPASRGSRSSCRGSKEVPASEKDSRSQEESSKIGEGTDAEIGGTVRVCSLEFLLVLAAAFFCFKSLATVGADESVRDFLVDGFFLGLFTVLVI